MKNLFSILLVLLFLPFSSHAKEDSGAIFDKIASGCKEPYKQSFESEALNESIKAYDSYTKCLRGKIDFLTQDYFIKDEKSVNFYNHKQFMHALDSVDDKYGSMMRALYLNGKGLLDENGKRSWEGSEAHIDVYSKIAKFHETLLMDILSLYTDLEIPLPTSLYASQDAQAKDYLAGNWLGLWQSEANSIEITKLKSGQFEFKGDAIWYGMKFSDESQVSHTGEFKATGIPTSNKVRIIYGQKVYFNDVPAKVDPFSCDITLILSEGAITATENGNCGGANVSFNGRYTK